MLHSVMDSAAPDNVLILVRKAPRSPAAEKARRTIRKLMSEGHADITVFFHGEAVAAAQRGQAADWGGGSATGSVTLLVCQAAWQRRFDEAMADGFDAASLVTFWKLAIDARRILSFGGSDDG